jgi:hypothetical protein
LSKELETIEYNDQFLRQKLNDSLSEDQVSTLWNKISVQDADNLKKN